MNRANPARCLLPDLVGTAEPLVLPGPGAVPARPGERGCCRCQVRAEPVSSATCRQSAPDTGGSLRHCPAVGHGHLSSPELGGLNTRAHPESSGVMLRKILSTSHSLPQDILSSAFLYKPFQIPDSQKNS